MEVYLGKLTVEIIFEPYITKDFILVLEGR